MANAPAIPVEQNTVVAGQPSLVTLVFTNADGSTATAKFYAPPGNSVTLPDNLLTLDSAKYFISGYFAMGNTDVPCQGIHWDTPNSQPIMVIGDNTDTVSTIPLVSKADLSNILRLVGGDGNLGYQCFSASITNSTYTAFPTAFPSSGAAPWAMAIPQGNASNNGSPWIFGPNNITTAGVTWWANNLSATAPTGWASGSWTCRVLAVASFS